MAGDVPVWPDNMALMTVKGGCLHMVYLLKDSVYRRLLRKIKEYEGDNEVEEQKKYK